MHFGLSILELKSTSIGYVRELDFTSAVEMRLSFDDNQISMIVEFPLILVELVCILICRCKKLSVAKKQMFVSQAPNVLVIQLKVRKPLLPCVYMIVSF